MAKHKSAGKQGVAVLDRSPSHLLHRALQRALDIYAEEFGAGGVTQRQYAVLAAAAEREGATQADLVRITGIDRSTLADMAQRMIGKGLLARERSAVDARANTVRLTPAGRETLDAALPRMAATDARLLKLVGGGGRRRALLELLQDLVSQVDAGDDQPKAAKTEKPKAKKKAKKKLEKTLTAQSAPG